MRIPVQPVKIEYFGDPNQSTEVIEAVVDEEEEPEVDLHTGRSVTGDLAIECCRGSYKSQPDVIRFVTVVAFVWERVLRERHGTPRNGLDGHMCQPRS